MELRKSLEDGLLWTAGALMATGLAVTISGCAGGSGPEDTYKALTRVDYGKPYIGMSKAEVLRCAGPPRSKIPAGSSAETLIYHYSGQGPVPGAPAKNTACTASLTFEREKLVRVSYAHKDVRSPYAWQSEDDPEKAERLRREQVPACVFSLPQCPR